jgi:hypothetical protein
MNGVVSSDLTRPRIRGGRLTEQNLRLWLSIVRNNFICAFMQPLLN